MDKASYITSQYNYCTDLESHLWQTENARLKLAISQIRNSTASLMDKHDMRLTYLSVYTRKCKQKASSGQLGHVVEL